MTNNIFEIVIIILFGWDAIQCFTKKNCGSDKMFIKYTEESVKKGSVIMGIAFVIICVCELVVLLSELGVINIGLPIDGSGAAPLIAKLAGLVVGIIIMIIVYATILKKKTGNTSSKGKGSEEEDF